MRGSITGKLILLSSKNPAVFAEVGVPMEISFYEPPQLKHSFLFYAPAYGDCHTSEVLIAGIDSETGDFALQTRNSLYKIVEVKYESSKN